MANAKPHTGDSKRLSLYILAFSFAFAVFFLAPPFLNGEFAPYPLMKVADVLDLFTPLVLIPLYWLLYRLDGNRVASVKENLMFMVFAAFWAMGQGMHLAANSIGHLVGNMKGTDAYYLTNFYDETLSHYLWHFGVIGLSGVLIYRSWRNPLDGDQVATWKVVLPGVVYGFTYFAIVVEGVTAPMGVPFAVLAVIFSVVQGRTKLRQEPVLFLFLVGYSVAIVLFAAWGIYWHGLPEFSKVMKLGLTLPLTGA